MKVVLLLIVWFVLWRCVCVVMRYINTRRARRRVSATWLESHAVESTKIGWDGPRWRTPAELARMNRVDRRKALSVVSSGKVTSMRERRAK